MSRTRVSSPSPVGRGKGTTLREDARELHRGAMEEARRRVRLIRPDQWAGPTPCTDWDVRDLVQHMTSGNAWIEPMFEGRTIAEVGDRFDGDLLGDDPIAAWEAAADGAVAAMEPPDAMGRTVHLSFGDVPGWVYAMERFEDLMVHSWDLARAIGADERLRRDLLDAWWGYTEPRETMLRATGQIGERIVPPPEHAADRQVVLLGILGRRGWPGSGIPPSTKAR